MTTEANQTRALPWDERVSILRLRCLDRKTIFPGGRTLLHNRQDFTDRIDARVLQETAALPWQRRMGLRTKARLEALPFAVDDLEQLAGRPDFARMAVPADERARVQQVLASYPKPAQTGTARGFEPLCPRLPRVTAPIQAGYSGDRHEREHCSYLVALTFRAWSA